MLYWTRVIAGKGRGHRIGFPTINMVIPGELGITHGIYAGWIHVHGVRHPAAIHYGPIPTFQEVAPTLEAYVLDGTIAVVPREISFEIVAQIRDIAMFLSAQELATQIQSDIEEVKKILKKHI